MRRPSTAFRISRCRSRPSAPITGSNSAGAASGYNGPEILEQVKAKLTSYESQLPPGYKMSYTGESEDQEEASEFLSRAFLLAVMLIFARRIGEFVNRHPSMISPTR